VVGSDGGDAGCRYYSGNRPMDALQEGGVMNGVILGPCQTCGNKYYINAVCVPCENAALRARINDVEGMASAIRMSPIGVLAPAQVPIIARAVSEWLKEGQ